MAGTGMRSIPLHWNCADDSGGPRVGYNHAHECRPVTLADVDKVKSRKSASAYVLQAARL